MKIFYSTFYVPLYTPPITISYVLDCILFFHFKSYFFYKEIKKKKKKHLASCDWWDIKWKIKSGIEDFHSRRERSE
jgi:hypothetical protein